MNKVYAVLVIFMSILFAKNDLLGQDIHYSQFYNSPLNINPALTGIFNGDVRIIGSVRDQWRQVEVPYTTFSANYDMKIYPKKNRDKNFFGFGAIFNYDRAGASSMNITDLNITGSYSYLLNKNNVLTAGLLLGFATEGYDSDGLSWDNYWDGTIADISRGSGENFANNRFSYLETGVGVNYRYQKSARTNLNLGIGAWHLLTPTASYDGINTTELPIRLAFNFEGTFKIANPLDIQLHANYNLQDEYDEILTGGLLRIHINQKPGSQYALDLGATWRYSGALIPKLAIHYNQWYIGASYDFNFDPFYTDFNIRQGGPEVHVRYIITNVKPLSQKKACPIY